MPVELAALRAAVSRATFKAAPTRPWICSNCIRQQTRLRRHQSTTATATISNSPSNPGALHDDRVLRQIFDSPDFWKDFSRASTNLTSEYKNVGLFKNRWLTHPQGFMKFATITLEMCKRIVDKVLNAESLEDYRQIARDLDRLSDGLCRVIDLSDFVRATNPNPRIQEAAHNAYSMMFEYMNVLNTTTGLNDQLKTAMATPEIWNNWTEEERVVATHLSKDFSKSAIDLPKFQREKFVEFSQEIAEVGTDFVNSMEPAKQVLSFPSSKLAGLDPSIARSITRFGTATLPMVGYLPLTALRCVRDEETRKQIMIASETASDYQIARLEHLLLKRAELSKLSGYASYGHMTLGDRMAKSPESVNKFLTALSEDNAPKIQKEVAELTRAKMTDRSVKDPTLQPWDKHYYMEQIKATLHSRIRSPDSLSAFFSLGTVMQGLSRLFTRLYGIRFVPREPEPGETWMPDVRRLDVVSETDGHVAVLYCDLFSRPGKSPNPAHFTLRCSREITPAEVEEASSHLETGLFENAEAAANDGMALSNSSGTLKQLPTIALICDFATPSRNSATPSLLSLNEYQTLFHEMGHAIHSILGRTSLQNVSGTRCSTDFAELPSILMEHFATDPTVLALFARHYETDQPLPYEMVANKIMLQKVFEGYDIEHQIILAMVDQSLHSPLALQGNFNSTEIYHGIQKKYGNMPADPPETCWQGFFGHLYGYGGVYYSYLFDRVLAGRCWQEVFGAGVDGGSVSRENGERMKEGVLRWGGGKDPWKCLADVLGDERVEMGDERAMATVGGWWTKDKKEKGDGR